MHVTPPSAVVTSKTLRDNPSFRRNANHIFLKSFRPIPFLLFFVITFSVALVHVALSPCFLTSQVNTIWCSSKRAEDDAYINSTTSRSSTLEENFNDQYWSFAASNKHANKHVLILRYRWVKCESHKTASAMYGLRSRLTFC